MSGFGYNVLGFGANASGDGAVLPPDDQFNRVSALLHMEGSNNGVNNVFDDGSSSNHTITANGNATQGSFGPFARPDGEWSVSFDGSGDYLQAANSADWDLGTGNFTWECYANINDITRTQWFFSVFTTNSGDNAWGLRLESNGTLNAYFSSDGGESPTTIGVAAASSGLTENAWHHIAVVKNGTGSNNIQVYVDGVSRVTGTFGAIYNTSLPLTIGRQMNTSYPQYFLGQISNIRIIKGTALYTGNFTPSTSKLTAVTNTKLLTCQSNRFVDNSSSGHTVTPSSNAAVTSFGPFLTSSVYDPAVNGASGYFDGDGDYLSIANSSDFNLSNNPFTFSFWAKFSAPGTLYGRYYYPSNQRETFIAIETDGTIRMRNSPNGNSYSDHATASGAFVFNQWNYIVITRTISGSDSVFKTYVNGTLSKTTTINITTIYYASQTTYIMNYGAVADSPTGYLCDFKLVNGTATAADSSNPTAPAANTTNTKLLLNMADAQAIDSAAQNNLTLVGNTDTSTGQAKFGNTSLFYDGSGDGAYYANGSALGTGDWTIETFLWVNDFDADLGVFQYGGADGALGGLILTSQKIRVLSSNVAVRLDTSGTINAQTWYHVAYVSYNGTIKVYINGTADSTTFDASSTTWTFTDTTVYVGARYYSSAVQAPFDGYLDEFRVSHFARYTSNFTAPTKAFADKGQ